MRVAMMMRDTEYRDALIEMISGLDKDIFIEIAGTSGIRKDAVIVTDIRPEEIETGSLAKIQDRTLFLLSMPVSNQSGHEPSDRALRYSNEQSPGNRELRLFDTVPHTVFKYSSTSEIIAELSLLYSAWSGDTGSITPSTRLIAVAGEGDEFSADRCRALAGQIMYRRGGSILILPLGYINDYAESTADAERASAEKPYAGVMGRGGEVNWFRRLMYMIDNDRNFAPESFTFCDSYGINYLRLPHGLNPLTDLTEEYLAGLIRRFCRHYETVILDTGTCLSRANLRIVSAADNILFFGSGRRISDAETIFGEEVMKKVRVIGARDRSAEELSLDDYVSELYGRNDEKEDNT